MAITYVDITREQIEGWLNTLQLHGRWEQKPGTAGMYLLPVSDAVNVLFSSTLKGTSQSMGHGRASAGFRLVSAITGKALNNKAMDKSHLKRTQNWQKTWKASFDQVRKVYLNSKEWYDNIAAIENRDEYKRDLLDRLKILSEGTTYPKTQEMLESFAARVQQGGVLSVKQMAVVERVEADRQRSISSEPPQVAETKAELAYGSDTERESLLARMRKLWVEAKRVRDKRLMGQLETIADKVKRHSSLSSGEENIILSGFTKYRIACQMRELVQGSMKKS